MKIVITIARTGTSNAYFGPWISVMDVVRVRVQVGTSIVFDKLE